MRNGISTNYLPESITKEILFERAQERFQDWARMYGDPSVSVTYMYEDMSASCYCGAPNDDFPEIIGLTKEVPTLESYDRSKFRYKGITFRVTSDETDDKEYIWCDKYKESDELVDWVWGTFFIGDKWQGNTETLDKFIDSQQKKEEAK